jgi:hypothetical protein
MMQYYSHHRKRVKYAAVLAIETKKKEPQAAASAGERMEQNG